jgi:hypothetical protein
LLVIFVLVIGTSLGGPLGLILAVPIAAVIKILASFFYEKIRAREHRRIEVIRSRADLERARERFPDLMNATVVLLIEGDALSWADLDLMTEVAGDGLDHAINLTVVTLDGVAGALAAAAGIATTAIPIGPERLDREYGDMPPPNLVTAD